MRCARKPSLVHISDWMEEISSSCQKVLCVFCKLKDFENRIVQAQEALHFVVLLCCGGVTHSKR